jgi:hypothetical protein
MLLKLLDRVTLLGVLPEQGDFVTLKIVRKLRESLAFDEEEISRLKIQQNDGVITWDTLADEGKEVTIGEKASDLIVGCLKKLDKEQKLTAQHYDLYEKFIVTE